MSKALVTANLIKSFRFVSGGHLDAENQLSKFSDCYFDLEANDADLLRKEFDAEFRHGLFRRSINVIENCFEGYGQEDRRRLCRILLATYSFENLEFDYNSLLYLRDVAPYLQEFKFLAASSLPQFRKLTTNRNALSAFERILPI